jgi:hypothetical protein
MAKKVKPPGPCGGSSLLQLPKLAQEDIFEQVREMKLSIGDRIVSRWKLGTGVWEDYRLTLVGFRDRIIPEWITERRSSFNNEFVPVVNMTWCDLRNCIWWKIRP